MERHGKDVTIFIININMAEPLHTHKTLQRYRKVNINTKRRHRKDKTTASQRQHEIILKDNMKSFSKTI